MPELRCRAPDSSQYRPRSDHSISTIMSSALNTSRLGTDFWGRPGSQLHSTGAGIMMSRDLVSRDA